MKKSMVAFSAIIILLLFFVGAIQYISEHEKNAYNEGYEAGFDDGYYEGYQDGHYTGSHGMD